MIISMVIVLIAALILAAMVLYTVAVLRAAQTRLLTGEPLRTMVQNGYGEREDEGISGGEQAALWGNCW